jgi:hypothetical protein
VKLYESSAYTCLTEYGLKLIIDSQAIYTYRKGDLWRKQAAVIHLIVFHTKNEISQEVVIKKAMESALFNFIWIGIQKER